MDLCISELHLRRPPWRLRNKVIAENLLPNKSVLDLGGGAANLLKYYSPTDYMCVDGMDMPEVDKKLDLNTDYQKKLPNNWDYAVNSGILEYVYNIELYLIQFNITQNIKSSCFDHISPLSPQKYNIYHQNRTPVLLFY